MISQTSRPISRHRMASSLTRAMFTLRKMFSKSFSISAARVEVARLTRSGRSSIRE